MGESTKTILTVIGARPQWMKAAALSRVLARPEWGISERIVHTGQHTSHAMAGQFMEELALPKAHHVLNVSSEPAIRMGQMMEGVMKAIQLDAPDAVLLYGDTDSTLAGAWAAARCGVPAVHVEAGLRSYDRRMPEEINRILTDQLSDVLFCPSESAVECLRKEGISNGARMGLIVESVGDLMLDTARYVGGHPTEISAAAHSVLLTLHRPSNVDEPERLKRWISTLGAAALQRRWQVIFPVHPRTEKTLHRAYGEGWSDVLQANGFQLHEPASYSQMLKWLSEVRQVWTDSGGLQKEAFFMHRPALILRETSEWTELIEGGYARLCPQPEHLDSAIEWANGSTSRDWDLPLYGDGRAAERMTKTLQAWLNR